jgi:hypothetical protein
LISCFRGIVASPFAPVMVCGTPWKIAPAG